MRACDSKNIKLILNSLGILTSVHTQFVHSRENIDNISLPKMNVKINTRRWLARRNGDTHAFISLHQCISVRRQQNERKWTICKMCQTKQEPYFDFMRNFPFGLIAGVSFNFLNYFCVHDKTSIYAEIVWLLLANDDER